MCIRDSRTGGWLLLPANRQKLFRLPVWQRNANVYALFPILGGELQSLDVYKRQRMPSSTALTVLSIRTRKR